MSSSPLAAGLRCLRGRMAAQCRSTESDEQLLHAFTTGRDEDAFTVLLLRHGPMVLHVCRRILGHEQDAEDAFQATFVLLARGATGLRDKSALAGFLHGAAHRIAQAAKRSASRRRKHEARRAGLRKRPESAELTRPLCASDPAEALSWREVRTLLDEEIARLPEKYRSVFVLCCLEELSQAEAARRLGVKERTLSSRLAEARKRLAQCLARRGVELTAVLAASTLASQSASALPAGLMATTIQAAFAAAASAELAGVVSPPVAKLLQGMTAAMLMRKAKMAAMLLTVGLLTITTSGSLVCWFQQASGPIAATPEMPTTKKSDEPRTISPKRETMDSVEIGGRVVDPDGKPVRGAKLVFIYGSGKEYPHKVWAVSASEGKFAFTVPVKDVDNGYAEKPWENTYVVAVVQGFGFAAAQLGKPGATDLTLQLVKDDAPIRGRILDLQGRPVAGARVRIANALSVPKKGGLTEWLAALKAHKDNPGIVDAKYLMGLGCPAFDLLFSPVLTGADGCFEMKGIGRERIAHLRIEGPAIATQEIRVMTRASETIRLPVQKEYPKGQSVTYLGASFDLLAAPSRPIVGVVREKDSGKPLAGVTVESSRIAHAFRGGFIRTTTDKGGRYRLDGLPKGDGNEIAATIRYWLADSPKGGANDIAAATNELPYLAVIEKVGNPPGLGPVTVDFSLKRGVWVKGRITDKNTGKPQWAGIEYFCFADNPRANENAHMGHFYNWRSSGEDGSFRIPVLPGHGLLAVRAYHDRYVGGVGIEQVKGPRIQGMADVFRTTPALCFASNYHTVIEVNPKPGEESIACNVILDPGRKLKGTVLGPDGKPLAGARASGLKGIGYWTNDPLVGADFTVECMQSNKPRLLSFVHKEKKLSGYLVVCGDEEAPLKVQLKPWCTLIGRVIAPLGTPLNSVRVNCWAEVKRNGQAIPSVSLSVYPGKDGRFRFEGLLAGVKYELGVSRSNVEVTLAGGNPTDLKLKPGETKDVGDLTVKAMQ